MLKNRMFFKFTSIILIQAFFLLQSVYAGQIKKSADNDVLAPALILNQQDLRAFFEPENEADLEDFDYSLTPNNENVFQLKFQGPLINSTQGTASGLNNSSNIAGNDTVIPPPEPDTHNNIPFTGQKNTQLIPLQNQDEEGSRETIYAKIGLDLYGQIEFLDFSSKISGNMATAKELGVPEETVSLIHKIRQIAKDYSDPRFWRGFDKVVIGRGEELKDALFVVSGDRINVLGVSVYALNDLIRLMNTAPSLFKEMIECSLAHEGGIKGHTSLWAPFEINWKDARLRDIEDIIIDATIKRQWPREMYVKGIPALSTWLPALSIIWRGLVDAGFDPKNPEPFGIKWTEWQANLGMFSEKGLRSISLWIWYTRVFDTNAKFSRSQIEAELQENFSFLKDRFNISADDILIEVEKINQEYNSIVAGQKSQPEKTQPPSTGIFSTLGDNLFQVLLFFVVSLSPIFLQSCSFVNGNPISSLAISTAAAVLFAGLIINFFRPKNKVKAQTDAAIISFVNGQMYLFQTASPRKKMEILNVTRQGIFQSRAKVIPGIMDDWLIKILDRRKNSIEKIRVYGARSVREFAAAGLVTEKFLKQIQHFIMDENPLVAANIVYALKLYSMKNKNKFILGKYDILLARDKFLTYGIDFADTQKRDLNTVIIADLIKEARINITSQPARYNFNLVERRKIANPELAAYVITKREFRVKELLNLIDTSI